MNPKIGREISSNLIDFKGKEPENGSDLEA
jgi:hypothetical protein